MSYCRFSSDDYQCAAYVWEDVYDGWRTEIAGRTRVLREGVSYPAPLRDMPDLEPGVRTPDWEAWADEHFARHRAVLDLIDETNEGVLWDWVKIPEPVGGRSYDHETPGGCADNLERLRLTGLNIPHDVIEVLREEQTELDDATSGVD